MVIEKSEKAVYIFFTNDLIKFEQVTVLLCLLMLGNKYQDTFLLLF